MRVTYDVVAHLAVTVQRRPHARLQVIQSNGL